MTKARLGCFSHLSAGRENSQCSKLLLRFSSLFLSRQNATTILQITRELDTAGIAIAIICSGTKY